MSDFSTQSLQPNYNPKDHENNIYRTWQQSNIGNPDFQNNSNSKTYTILMPPPNLTGNMHAGHAFGHYVMDTLSRIARQKGQKDLWFPGVDHAGLQLEGVIDKLIRQGEFDDILKNPPVQGVATQETGVVSITEGEGIFRFAQDDNLGGSIIEVSKEDLPKYLKTNYPELWLECAWSKVNLWRDNQQNQASVLGDTPDYSRSLFTLDDKNIEMVNYAFLKYWQDGLIYKGSYLVNWSVGLGTALSDVSGEIEYEKRIDPFITFEYRLFSKTENAENPSVQGVVTQETGLLSNYKSLNQSILVGTVRPETIFGDYAVAVHPEVFKQDYSQFQDLLDNKKLFVQIPLTDRMILVILADEVDPSFGSGALKITPAHDIVDYDIFNKYIGGEFEQAIGRDGKLTQLCDKYSGLSVEIGRKLVIKDLIEQGFVPKKPTNNRDFPHLEGVSNKTGVSTKNYFNITFEDNINPEDYQVDWNYEHNVTVCERTRTVVEPLISEEFFVSYHNKFKWKPINKDDNVSIANRGQTTNLQELGIKAVNQTNFHSPEYKDRAVNFLENIKDWCISRDLIWGHKMPVWYNLDTNSERKFWSYEEMQNTATPVLSDTPSREGHPSVNFDSKNKLPINPKLIERAKEMAKNMTTGEQKIWFELLKNSSYKWIKQRIIDNYIVDFFCAELKLVIEIDGQSHNGEFAQEYDEIRTNLINNYGIKVVRFGNNEIFESIEKVKLTLESYYPTLEGVPHSGGGTFVNQYFAISAIKPTIEGNWVQEEKILDTWFSSCLWPLSTLDYPEFVSQKIPHLEGVPHRGGGTIPKPNVVLIHGGEVWQDKSTYRSKIQSGELNSYWYSKFFDDAVDGSRTSWKTELSNYCKSNFISLIKPQMPSKTNADYDEWKRVFEQSLPFINSQTVLIGSSLGSMFLTKYLNENQLVFKSAFLISGGLWEDTETNIVDFDPKWGLSTNLEILNSYANKINIVHSKDDNVVDFARSVNLKSKLPNASFVQLDGLGHLGGECKELENLIQKSLIAKLEFVLIHGSPETSIANMKDKNFLGWLKNTLVSKGYSVLNPELSNSHLPDYETWKKDFEAQVGQLNSNSVVVAHSAGGAFVVRYLSEILIPIKKLILMSPSLVANADNTRLSDLLNFTISPKIKELGIEIVICTSDNEPQYRHDNVDSYLNSIGGTKKVFNGLGHFRKSDMGRVEFPEILKLLPIDSIIDFEVFYPTQEMLTAKEIFYQWIVRMTTLSYYFTAQIPYTDLIITPTVLDEKGKKMSKSLGNGLEPVAQINKYSSDALRMAMLGGMIPNRNMKMGGRLADELCEKYRNFGNKMWNVARFFEYQEQKLKNPNT